LKAGWKNGLLFYSVKVAPQNQYRDYERAFLNMPRSVKINSYIYGGAALIIVSATYRNRGFTRMRLSITI
jgi:hypothetical protein